MPKTNTIFECQKCGTQAPKWSGRCLECGNWGSLEETSGKKQTNNKQIPVGKTINLKDIKGQGFKRQLTGIKEFDTVLGGGIVPGSLMLLGGEPGIGKSTLILQIACQISRNNQQVLYVSGEESGEQIKLRLDRLELNADKVKFLGETEIETIASTIAKEKPSLVIIDSIQTCFTSELPGGAGSVSQVRACTVKLLQTAKKENIPIFIIGHVTKEGEVAGPKTLEHLVDTVLYLEGERYHIYRVLRTIKNRFGSTGELGIFEMTGRGLKEVANCSTIFLGDAKKPAAGTAIACVMEGSRPLLIEIQALVNKTSFGYPQRKSEGFPLNRLQLLIAVLTQKGKLPLQNYDVYIKIAGGLKINEPAADLAVALAIASALKNTSLGEKSVILGEVGLSGEIRAVIQLDKRLKEMEKMGFKKIILPAVHEKNIKTDLKISSVNFLTEALNIL